MSGPRPAPERRFGGQVALKETFGALGSIRRPAGTGLEVPPAAMPSRKPTLDPETLAELSLLGERYPPMVWGGIAIVALGIGLTTLAQARAARAP